jgi:hypothetical protein
MAKPNKGASTPKPAPKPNPNYPSTKPGVKSGGSRGNVPKR